MTPRGGGRLQQLARAALLHVPLRLLRLAGWLRGGPMFVVRTRRVHHQAMWLGASVHFWLSPTLRYWVWMALGIAVVASTLMPFQALALVTVAVSAFWLSMLWWRMWRLSRHHHSKLGTLYAATPLGSRFQDCAVWLPCAAGLLAAATVNLGWIALSPGQRYRCAQLFEGLSLDTAVGIAQRALSNATFAAYLCTCLLLACAYALAAACRRHLLRLPAVTTWFNSLPAPARKLVHDATHTRVRYPSSTWRRAHDLSQEANAGGLATGLFSDNVDRAAWRQSTRYLTWYFAPVIVPLIGLLTAPVLVDALAGPKAVFPSQKLALGWASFVWATWALSFFLARAGCDLADRSSSAGGGTRQVYADLLQHLRREVRRAAKHHFDGRGQQTLNVVAALVVPFYIGYLGAFGQADADSAATPAPLCSPAASASASASAPAAGATACAPNCTSAAGSASSPLPAHAPASAVSPAPPQAATKSSTPASSSVSPAGAVPIQQPQSRQRQSCDSASPTSPGSRSLSAWCESHESQRIRLPQTGRTLKPTQPGVPPQT